MYSKSTCTVTLLVGRNNNLPADGKTPDVEFQKNGETWVLDVRFTKPHNEEESYSSKIDKYQHMYKNRVIPVVIGYSGRIYYKSKQLLKEHLLQVTEDYLMKHMYLSIIKTTARGIDLYVKKIKEGLINEEIVRRYPGSDNWGIYVIHKGKGGGLSFHLKILSLLFLNYPKLNILNYFSL